MECWGWCWEKNWDKRGFLTQKC